MIDQPISSERMRGPTTTRWLVAMAPFLLGWTFAPGVATAQERAEESDDSKVSPVARAKQRSRLLGRLFGGKPEVEPPPAPPSRPRESKANQAADMPGPAPVDPALVPAQLSNYLGYSYGNLSNVQTGSEADQPFIRRLIDAYKDEPDEPEPPDPNAPPSRRGLPAPFDAPPMPFSDFIGALIGVNDTSVFPLMDAFYRGPNGDAWKKSRIKIYGWTDPSYNASTSKGSNAPLAYNIVPNALELSQQVVILERPLDTVQQDHCDWGFRFTSIYGIDYRFTTGKGYFSNQLLKHNHLYGYDPLQMYLEFYFPHIADGTTMRIGRYISPLDIEAQLSPDNFLYTHSNMFAVDPYTFTGVQFASRFNDYLTLLYGAQCGNDMAPWTKSSQPNGEILIRWVSKSNKDSLWGGLDSIGKGYYSNGHDDLQVLGLTWSHKFNDKWATMTEQYYIWQRQALQGGTVINGPPHPFYEATGPGKLIPGLSNTYGIVNYTSYILSDKSLLVFRSDCLADFQGQRTGIPGAYFEHTVGIMHHINSWAIIRPEVRFDYTSGQKGYDNGTKRDQFTFNMDIILRF